MDPLSITLACVTLLDATAKLSKLITAFVKGTREARRDVDAFNRELSSLSLCVSMLKDEDFKFPDQLQANLVSVLSDCEDVIGSMETLLQNRDVRSVLKRVKWSLTDRDEVMRLRNRLEAHKATLDITLDMANLVMIMAVKEDTSIIKGDTAAIKEDTTNIKAELESLRTEVMQFRLGTAGSHPILNRFLTEAVAYTESVVDPLDDHQEHDIAANCDHDNEGSPPAMSKPGRCSPPIHQRHLSEVSIQSFQAAKRSDEGHPAIAAERNTSQPGDDSSRQTPRPSIESGSCPPCSQERTDSHNLAHDQKSIGQAPEVQNNTIDNSQRTRASDNGPVAKSASEIEKRVKSVLDKCGSSIDDKAGALLWYWLETIELNKDETVYMEWILQQGIDVNSRSTER